MGRVRGGEKDRVKKGDVERREGLGGGKIRKREGRRSHHSRRI